VYFSIHPRLFSSYNCQTPDETGTSEATFLFSKLQKALKEKVAYQEFLLDLDVEKFKEYLR